MTNFTEEELRRRIDRRVAPIGGEVASHEVRIAELESKLANILLPAEIAGYLGQTELDTLRNIAQRAVAATANLESTQASMLGVAANLNIALEELRATISGTITTLSDEDISLQEKLAIVEERINEVAILVTQMPSLVVATVNELDDVGDVTLGTLTSGEVLKWNGSAWVNGTDDAGTTISSIDDIADVVVTTPADNSVLAWDTSTSKWIDQTAGEAGISDSSHTHTDKLDAASYTASDILSKIATVDGPSSGLNADLLDDQHAAAFAASEHFHTLDALTDVATAGQVAGSLLKSDGANWTPTTTVLIGTAEAPLNIPQLTSDPVSVSNGDLWLVTIAGTTYIKARVGGATLKVALGA